MIIKGKNVVYEKIMNGGNIEKLSVDKDMKDTFSNRIIAEAKKRKVKINFVERKLLDKYYDGHHQGFVAHVSDYKYFDIDEIIKKNKATNKRSLFILLDGVEDPVNMGSIMRTAECAGVDAIIIPKHRSVGVTDTAIKVSSGANEYIKVCKVTNINDTIIKMKEQNIWVYGIELGGENIFKNDFSGDIALVMGGEGCGLHEQTKKNCDKILSIPMLGKINSLNVSTATAIATFNVVRIYSI